MNDSPEKPDMEEALALYRAGRHAEAARLCHALAVRRPEDWRALHLLGVIALERRQPAMAADFLAAAAGPGGARVRAGLAMAYRDLDRLTEASAELAAAIALEPGTPHYYFNRGNLLQRLDDIAGAEIAYRRALALEPALAEAHLNLAHLLLRCGRWLEAWPEYEWRWLRPGAPVHYRRHSAWDGAAFPGRTLLLYTEQGFGDAIQFSRYLPRVAERGGRVVLECPAELVRLFSASFPQVAILPKGHPPPPFDLQASLPSLPGLFRATPDTVPAAPYLKVPQELTTAPAEAGGLKVGLVWACSPGALSQARTMPPATLAPLLAVPGVRFHSLQVGYKGELPPWWSQVADLAPALKDFADTAAAVARLDLVITVDTAVAHVAGALGRPVWILLPEPGDWRWLRDRADTPWYPTATLFRQPRRDDWESVATEVAARLAALASGAGPVR